MILSAAMMLRYTLDRPDQAARIEKAIRTVLHNGVRTAATSGRRVPARRHPGNGRCRAKGDVALARKTGNPTHQSAGVLAE
jgi:hypothetical protein